MTRWLGMTSSSVHNRWTAPLADRHTDCHCYSDIRCQLAVAFQQARDYWAANPNSTEHAPNEIHQSIEQWLVAKNILIGPAVTTQEPEPRPPASPTPKPERRRSLKLPGLRRPISMNLRRLSLPAMKSTQGTIARPQRRQTDSTTTLPSPSAGLSHLPRLSPGCHPAVFE
ncbi:hypothetical protein C8Q76DRAFT_698422 [Earliella scabrosa]|nr:hypothetical protein C8Q76DRAFT_698422 [Earliella scabrosa]